MNRRNLLRAVISLMVVASTLVALESPAAAATRGPYWYLGSASDRCFDDPGSQTANNVVMDIYSCLQGHRNEEWWETDTDSGFVMIENRSSGKCLTVQNASKADNAQILQYTCNHGDNQQWMPVLYTQFGLDWYQLKNRNSGMCITVKNASVDDGAKLIQYTCAPIQGNNIWTWYIPLGA